MQDSSQSSRLSALSCADDGVPRWKREDRAYQSMTVAAIVLLLFSLWVF